MKAHSEKFKEQIKTMGREIDSKISYTIDGVETVLGKEELNAVTPLYKGAILKSVMKQLEIDSNVEIPVGTVLKYEFGVKVDGEYEYLNFGNYVVKDVEKQEDTASFKITCYDKLLYSMIDYESPDILYPITIKNYINAVCEYLGLTFKNINEEFANHNKEIPNELYLTTDGKSLGYTFRDVLDELAQVTASTICLNENDELEIRYINDTGDTIDEEFLKNVNINFGEKFGPVNVVVLSRSGGSDNIYYPETLPENPVEIKISDNQIMNFNNRDEFMPAIYEKLNGLEYYVNDFSSTGIAYYELCDRYNVKIGNKEYSCVMFNDELLITQGLQEDIFTELPEETKTDFTKADKTDRRINQVYLIVDKQNQTITSAVKKIEENVMDLTDIKNSDKEQQDSIDNINGTLNSTNSNINDLQQTITVIKETMLTQTAEAFEMLFKKTGIQETVDNLEEALKDVENNQNTITEYIRFEGAKIILGKSTSQTKLIIENDIIKFMTGENVSAYISENQLYITDSTILNKLEIGNQNGRWEKKVDKRGNLNTKWVGVN